MKVVSSLKSLKKRGSNGKKHGNAGKGESQLVKRRGVWYVINKLHPRFKARQGSRKKK